MKLTVFGAIGGVGREVVTQALDAGDHVTAYVRNRANAGFSGVARPRLELGTPRFSVVTFWTP
jgi:uncharacterized protein YbjT (DUF2867 family)